MQDPAQLYRFETDVDVRSAQAPTLLVALSGFMDAGHTQRLLVDHLLVTLDHRVVATFDADQLLDYRGRRPAMTLESDHWTHYEDPTLALYRFVDDKGAPFLLLSGLEPDFQWERVVEAVRGLVGLLGVRTVLSMHGVPMAVPHTRPIGATYHGSSEERRSAHPSPFGTIQVPGSLATLLEYRLGEHGIDAGGLSVHVPHYLAQSDFTPAALAALQMIAGGTGLHLPDSALALGAAQTLDAVAGELANSPEAEQVVTALETQYDAFVQRRSSGLLDEQDGQMPTADELGAEFEAFLRGQFGSDQS